MKRMILFLLPIFLVLSACSAFGTPDTSVQVLQTSIAMTQTANPTKTPGPNPNAPNTLVPSPSYTPMGGSAPLVIPSPTYTAAPPPSNYTPAPYVPSGTTWNPYYADQFIYYYYQHINNRDYTTTWSLLTPDFKAVVNPDGYAGYTSFWNTVQRVQVDSVVLSNFNGYVSDATVYMTYIYNSGTYAPDIRTFHLSYDLSRGTWMFDLASAASPATGPDQFIYYYFNNINARNYSLTWSLLTDSFIAANNSAADGGYAGYVNYWNSVSRVDVTYVTINNRDGNYADVTAGLFFNNADSTVSSASVLFHLVYNTAIGSWQFYSP